MVKARIILSLFFLFDLLVYFSSIWFGNYFTRSVFKFIPDIWSLSPLKAKSRTMGERQTYLLWQRFTTFQLNLFIIMSYRNIFFFRKRWLFRAHRLISLPLSNVHTLLACREEGVRISTIPVVKDTKKLQPRSGMF